MTFVRDGRIAWRHYILPTTGTPLLPERSRTTHTYNFLAWDTYIGFYAAKTDSSFLGATDRSPVGEHGLTTPAFAFAGI